MFYQPDLVVLTTRVQNGDNYGITDRRSGVEKVVIKIIAHVLTSLFFKINSFVHLFSVAISQRKRMCLREMYHVFTRNMYELILLVKIETFIFIPWYSENGTCNTKLLPTLNKTLTVLIGDNKNRITGRSISFRRRCEHCDAVVDILFQTCQVQLMICTVHCLTAVVILS